MSTRFAGPCKFFLENKCNRGENCKFSHELNPPNPPISPGGSSKPRPPSGTPRGPWGNRNRPRGHSSGAATARAVQLENSINELVLGIRENDKSKELPTEPQKEEPPTQERIMGGYRSVRFGPGLEVLSISLINITSPTAIVSNLPKETQPPEVWALALEFKADLPFNAVRCTPRGETTQAIIHFDDLMAANAAIKALDGRNYKGNPLAAKALKPTSTSEDVTKIECSWFQPAKAAHLQFVSEAAAAAAMNVGTGKEIRGHRIKCLPQSPRPGFSRPYSILVVGLHVETTEDDLRGLFSFDGVKMKEPKFNVSREDTIAYIRSLFDGTRITDLKILSEPQHDKQKVMIGVESAEHARRFYKENDGKRHSFLGNTTLDLSLTYSATFRIPLEIYRAIKDEFDALVNAEKAKGRDPGPGKGNGREKGREDDAPARFKIFDSRPPATVHINGRGRPAVVRAKTELQKLLRGELICGEDGKALWDPALGGVEGKKLIRDVKNRTGVHVNCDLRNQTLTLYGSLEKRVAARAILAEQYQQLLNRQHEIPLVGKAYGHFLRGGLAAVQQHLGIDKVIPDLPNRRLFVRCSPAQVTTVKNILRQPPKKAREGNTTSDLGKKENECLICFDSAEDPVKAPCGHTYCRECANGYLRSTIETQKFPITCVGTGDESCEAALSIHIVKSILSRADTDRLFERVFASYIQARPNEYYYCPTIDCSTVYNVTTTGEVFTCPQCFTGICTTCKAEVHYGQTCVEYQIATNPELRDKMLQEWKEKTGVKTCPGCKVDVEKNDGCNHMQCRCGAHWCWMCAGQFPDGEAVYTHMPGCNGQQQQAQPQIEPQIRPPMGLGAGPGLAAAMFGYGGYDEMQEEMQEIRRAQARRAEAVAARMALDRLAETQRRIEFEYQQAARREREREAHRAQTNGGGGGGFCSIM